MGIADVANREVSRFTKSLSEVVVAAVRPWRNRTYVNVRAHYLAADGSIYPTAKGLTLPAEQLPDLARAVHALETALNDTTSALSVEAS